MKLKNGNLLRLNKNFVSCSFTSFMASKTNTGSFYGFIRPLFVVLLYGFTSRKGRDVDET